MQTVRGTYIHYNSISSNFVLRFTDNVECPNVMYYIIQSNALVFVFFLLGAAPIVAVLSFVLFLLGAAPISSPIALRSQALAVSFGHRAPCCDMPAASVVKSLSRTIVYYCEHKPR